jgi:hypothetical protein
MVRKYSKILVIERLIYLQFRGKKTKKKKCYIQHLSHITAEEPWINVYHLDRNGRKDAYVTSVTRIH